MSDDPTLPTEITCYAISAEPPQIVPAPPHRGWMDEHPERHPYRCLPLAIGNGLGWQILLPCDVSVWWNGGPAIEDVEIECERDNQAVSNFARGIVTFDVPYIFRTPPGVHLLVTGPSNEWKDGAGAMTAVVETDWVPYTFTMNWQMLRPGRVDWKAGEPYCQILPLSILGLDAWEPVIRTMPADSDLDADHRAWAAKRDALRQRQRAGDWSQSWSRDYFVGRYADGRRTEAAHTQKLRLKAPRDARG